MLLGQSFKVALRMKMQMNFAPFGVDELDEYKTDIKDNIVLIVFLKINFYDQLNKYFSIAFCY